MSTTGDRSNKGLLNDLLEDAKLVASFGQRAGLLTNSAVFQAIQDAEASSALHWRDKEAVDLQKALNEAVRAIHPIKLVDLKSNWDPFNNQSTSRQPVTFNRGLIITLAIILMLSSVVYSQWMKEAEYVVALHELGTRQMQTDRISNVFEEFFAENAESQKETISLLADPRSSLRVSLRRRFAEIQSLQAQLDKNKQSYNAIIKKANPVEYFKGGLRNFWRSVGFQSLWERMKSVFTNNNKEKSEQSQLIRPVDDQQLESQEFLADQQWNPFIQCYDDYNMAISMKSELKDPHNVVQELSNSVIQDSYGRKFIGCITGTNHSVPGLEYDHANLNGKIEIFSLWILPALFGMLGAVIYHLRACLNQLRPDPRLGRALLRTFLGGFGGVAFGWFWSPATTEGLIATTLPLGAYAIAFLIGYSIDVFYAMLDKIVVMLTHAIDNIGRPNTEL